MAVAFEDFDRRGFAGTIVPEQGIYLAGSNLKIQSINRDHLA
jgi:hypothetical protein